MSIRKATVNDTFVIRQLHDMCLTTDVDLTNIYFSRVYKPENALVCIDGGHIVACAELLPANARLNNRTLRCGLLINIMTHPDYRGLGHMTRLLEAVDAEAKSRYYNFIFVNQTKDECIEHFLQKRGFAPAFGKKMTEITVEPRSSSRITTLIETDEPMIRKHNYKHYIVLEKECIEAQVEYLRTCRDRTSYTIMLRNTSGLKIAWALGWRDSYDHFTALAYYGKSGDINSLISNLCRQRNFTDKVKVMLPQNENGCHYGMAKLLNDKSTMKDLDDLCPEMTFAGIM